EAELYFEKLPSKYHHSLVNKLVKRAIESKEADAILVSDLFRRACFKSLCSKLALEEGFLGVAGFLDDIVVDAPKATEHLAVMMKGSGFEEEQQRNIASKSRMNGNKLLQLSC
ncbi:hypothetical protein C8R42DRAFT_579719, partial [Lentinula raphanica]